MKWVASFVAQRPGLQPLRIGPTPSRRIPKLSPKALADNPPSFRL
jgi:hypothetical protein